MNLIHLAVRRPVSVLMLYGLVAILGLVCYWRLPVELLPNVSFRHITIYVPVRGGMPPDEVEKLITQPIEDALSSVTHLARLESISKTGNSTVVLSFSPETNMDLAVLEVREKFTRVKDLLPKEIEKPIIAKYQQSDIPVFIVALVSPHLPTEKLREWVDEKVKERLLQVSGVANVEVSGGRERKILVEADLERLNAARLTLDQVIEAIHQNNLDVVVGELEEKEKKFLVRGLSALKGVSELENLVVARPAPQTIVYLKDVASVKDTYFEPQSFSRMNAENVVTLYIQKESAANTPEVCRLLRREIERLEKEKGEEVQFSTVSDQSLFIQQALNQVCTSLAAGAILAMGILYFFLRSWRPTLLLAATLPLALLATFAAMFGFNVSINVMSLSGLALGIGMLVDSSILVLENIFKKAREEENLFAAAESGTREVWLALAASTLTTLIVFLPLIYLDPELRLLYGGLALTVTFSLLASLFIAVTLIPSYFPRLMRSGAPSAQPPWREKLENRYATLLEKTLARRGRLAAVLACLFLLCVFLAARMEKELSGNQDQGKFTIFVELPAGAKLEVSDVVVKEVEDFLSTMPEVETISSRIEGWSSKVFVSLAPERERKLSTPQVMDKIRPALAHFGEKEKAFCYFSEVQSGRSQELSFEIYGHDYVRLKDLAHRAGALIAEVPGMGEIKLRYKEGRPELNLVINREKAALAGMTPQEIADTLHAHLRGVEATKFHTETREIETIVRLQEPDRATREQIKNLTLVTPRGESVALAELVDFEDRTAPSEIWRKGKQRMIEVSATSFKLTLPKALEKITQQLTQLALPKGYFLRLSEDYFAQKRRFSQLMLALAVTLVLIYMLLASIFESYLQPLLVMVSVPLAAIGALPLLFLVGKPITLGVLVGGILLAGIVVNNAIVLIETFNQMRRAGVPSVEALTRAGQERLQPILMTSLTTILGLLPMALFTTRSETLWSPLALTVIGGLAASTLLTLFVVPLLLKATERSNK